MRRLPTFIAVSVAGFLVAVGAPAPPTEAAPRYASQVVSQSGYVAAPAGSTASLTLQVRNVGTATWHRSGPNPTRLGTSAPRDRASALRHTSWISPGRAASMQQAVVIPGQVATFQFQITVPAVGTIHREYFAPVIEGAAWLTDQGIFWEVTPTGGGVDHSPANYAYQYAGQSVHPTVTPGGAAAGWVAFRNTGRAVWKRGAMNLGTSGARDRVSAFADPGWLGGNRIQLDAAEVLPGQVGRFSWQWRAAPMVTPGTYRQYFQPVVDGVTWLPDIGLYWNLAVTGAGGDYVGVNWHPLYYSTDWIDRQLRLMQQVGVRSVRLNASWYHLEPSIKGLYNQQMLNKLDYVVDRAAERNIEVLIVTGGSPWWAGGGGFNRPPGNPTDYGEFVGMLANRYAGKVAAYEIWNEPNVPHFFNGTPVQYVQLVQAAYPRVKQADPSAAVLAGSLSKLDEAYLQALYGAGLQGYFDQLAVHPYAATPEQAAIGLQGYLAVMQANGDGAKPLAITEFGYHTAAAAGAVSEAQQANYLTRAFVAFRQVPNVTGVHWYEWINSASFASGYSAADPEQNYGLVSSTEHRHKPGLRRFLQSALRFDDPR